jgi:hypothetical protein
MDRKRAAMGTTRRYPEIIVASVAPIHVEMFGIAVHRATSAAVTAAGKMP